MRQRVGEFVVVYMSQGILQPAYGEEMSPRLPDLSMEC